ncbi:condensation domain-containing protein [Kitasatospora sp. NPDC093558]|uniref:condensation domain-containing protein n=1 Tax=Kitasatospora sp. NPDC093558 TaxID=3155201 RepID=UPI00341222C0
MQNPHQLSHAQRALWFLHRLAPDSAVYHTGVALTVRSAVDLPALRAAVTAAADRHDMLRSLFREQDGQAVRIVAAHPPVGLELRELPGRTDQELRAAVRAALIEPFALEWQGAFRFVLLRRAAADAVLLMAGHHIATDATSNWLILRDVLDGYRRITSGESAVTAPPSGSYDDYVVREQTLLQSPRGARMEQYWHRVCDGAEPAEIPTDRPRPAGSSGVGSSYHLDLSGDRVRGLRDLARSSEVTLFAVLLGVLQGLLHRYTRQNRFLIGCPTTTRISPDSREVVGNYINTLVFRADLAPGATFREAVAAADRQVKSGLGSLGYPFELLTRTVNRPRTGGGSSLCRITLNLIGAPSGDPLLRLLLDPADGATAEVAGLHLAPFELPQAEGQLDLAVNVRQSADTLAVDFRYDVDLFDPSTIERFAGYFTRAIDAALAEPDSAIARLALYGGKEFSQLLAYGQGVPASAGRSRRRG